MDINSVIELLNSVENTGWTKFEVTHKDFTLKLERDNEKEVIARPPVKAIPTAPKTTAVAEEVAQSPTEKTFNENDKSVESPLVGIYHNPKESIKIGDKVKKGTIVCLIEAMKLMNEITMPEDGEITWCACAENDSVEFGQMLFKYTV